MSSSHAYLITLATNSAMDAAQGPDESFVDAKMQFAREMLHDTPATTRDLVLRHWDLIWNHQCGTKPAIDLGMVDA